MRKRNPPDIPAPTDKSLLYQNVSDSDPRMDPKIDEELSSTARHPKSRPWKVREQLQQMREQLEPIIEARFGQHQVVIQKIDVLLRGGRPRPFALVGASGTGKSFRALLFAETRNIPYLIDDGILIEGERIIAGRSAKNEPMYIKAIKTALFDDPNHLNEVRKAIKEHKVRRILLVGTSVKMVRLIGERLGLPKIAAGDITQIEEISSHEEIEKAQKSRHEGHHIIPVPAVEVSREYGSLFRDGFQVFLSDLRMGMKHYLKENIQKKGKKVFEKTVVKPPFMKKGDNTPKSGPIKITESALRQMLCHCMDEYNHDILVDRMKIRPGKVKIFIKVPLNLVKGESGTELNHFLYQLQNYVVNRLHRYAGVVLDELSIEVTEFI
ncbi:MAG: hypothetical protein AAF975_03240 [Spirochaetota bacterium]